MLSLPGLLIEWDAAEPVGDEVFVQYNLYRRRAAYTDPFGNSIAAAAWERIAVLTDIGDLAYTDYNTPNGTAFRDYTVTWVANIDDTLLESDKPEPVNESPIITYAYIHDVSDPTRYCVIRAAPPITLEPVQAMSLTNVRGRQTPTAFFDETESIRLVWPVRYIDLGDFEVWDRLYAMFQAQRAEGSIFCFRSSHSNLKFFVQIARLNRTDNPYLLRPALELQEVYYSEAV